MTVGLELQGIVRSVKSYGAFVDVGASHRLPLQLAALADGMYRRFHDGWAPPHLQDAARASRVCWERVGGDRERGGGGAGGS